MHAGFVPHTQQHLSMAVNNRVEQTEHFGLPWV